MDYPPVIALIITYERTHLAVETIKSVKEKVIYPNIGFHIADDGSSPEHIERLLHEIGGSYSVEISNAQRGGVGRSMNLGIEAALKRADLWLHLEDDWVLPAPLDLKPHVDLLMQNGNIGMVRLGRLSAGITAKTIPGLNGECWWELRRASDTYVFSGNASLRHRRFHDAYGPYREGLPPGRTELWYCDRFNRGKGPEIVWPSFLSTKEMFVHIGDHHSYKWWIETGGLTAEEAAEKFKEST